MPPTDKTQAPSEKTRAGRDGSMTEETENLSALRRLQERARRWPHEKLSTAVDEECGAKVVPAEAEIDRLAEIAWRAWAVGEPLAWRVCPLQWRKRWRAAALAIVLELQNG